MAADEVEGSLRHEQALERLDRLAQQGLWQVGRDIAGRTFVDIYRRSSGYFLLNGGPTNAAGFRTTRRDLPATVVEVSAPAAVLGATVIALLDAPDLRREEPIHNARFPVLRQARVRSWLDLIRTSATVSVVRLGAVYSVSTWVRDRSRLDGRQVPGHCGYAVLQTPTTHELGVALRVAADAVTP